MIGPPVVAADDESRRAPDDPIRSAPDDRNQHEFIADDESRSAPDDPIHSAPDDQNQMLRKCRGFAIKVLTIILLIFLGIKLIISQGIKLIYQGVKEIYLRIKEIFQGIKEVYDLKKIHDCSEKILQCMCEHLSTLDYEEYEKAEVHRAIHRAAKNGIVEFVIGVVKVFPHAMLTGDQENSRNIFMSAIANRQEKVFSLFYGLGASREGFLTSVDSSGNTMLHLAAKLSPSSQLDLISGAALQMQRELQWYKEVESIINAIHKDVPNKDGQTAKEVFTKEHKELLVKGEKWMKRTASSCTVVGALIITIMFAAAFKVPGGNDEKVYPDFKHKKPSTIFLISDAISLFSSSTSVLMFLGILTSRYAEEDFLTSLPAKLIIGLSTLFISIASMMVAFCSALIIISDGRLHIIIPIVSLACIPVILFFFLQFRLLVEIFKSTYASSTRK